VAKYFFVVTETDATVLMANMDMLATMTKVVQLFFTGVLGDELLIIANAGSLSLNLYWTGYVA